VAGSGNWGSAMAKIIGNNCLMQSHLDSEVSALLLPMLRTSGLLL
jgi:glycerol-3-phosphate dehydrogenase